VCAYVDNELKELLVEVNGEVEVDFEPWILK